MPREVQTEGDKVFGFEKIMSENDTLWVQETELMPSIGTTVQ